MSPDRRPQTQEVTVLIVDDTPANLAVVVESLEELDVEVAVAQDAEEALARAEYLRPALILLDVVMPRVDGFELCRRLKALERTRDSPWDDRCPEQQLAWDSYNAYSAPPSRRMSRRVAAMAGGAGFWLMWKPSPQISPTLPGNVATPDGHFQSRSFHEVPPCSLRLALIFKRTAKSSAGS